MIYFSLVLVISVNADVCIVRCALIVIACCCVCDSRQISSCGFSRFEVSMRRSCLVWSLSSTGCSGRRCITPSRSAASCRTSVSPPKTSSRPKASATCASRPTARPSSKPPKVTGPDQRRAPAPARPKNWTWTPSA